MLQIASGCKGDLQISPNGATAKDPFERRLSNGKPNETLEVSSKRNPTE
jgi:hypothetical protein